jgi:hypothetical protein
MQHSDARHALRTAFATAPAVVGWKSGGWVVYNPTLGAPAGVEPEVLVLATGRLPIPLSDLGAEVWRSVLAATCSER